MAGIAEDVTGASGSEGADDDALGISADELTQLARLVEENGLSELRLEEGGLRVTLRTASYRAAFGPVATVAAVAPAIGADSSLVGETVAETGVPVSAPAASSANVVRIDAPIMGVFYRSSAPSEPPLVEVGDIVEIGQSVGVIEAMKVFSEVPADRAGRVREIPAQNGSLVQPGEPLLILEAV